MTDTEILDWADDHLYRCFGETTVDEIEWWNEKTGKLKTTKGKSLRDCVIKANEDK